MILVTFYGERKTFLPTILLQRGGGGWVDGVRAVRV